MADGERLALVTGTSSGIGAALARRLLRAGWAVIGLARRPAEIDDPAYEHLRVDLGDLARLRAVAQARLGSVLGDARWTRVALVNNAAAPGSYRGVDKTDPLQLAEVFAVNSVAPTFLMGLVLRLVPRQTPLRIVNISSGAAVRGFPGLSDYGSSKAALRLAAMALAAELDADASSDGKRRDAAIMSYEPGVVDTAMQASARAADPEEFPLREMFRDLAARGDLMAPDAVTGDIVDFLDGAARESFVERRYSAP